MTRSYEIKVGSVTITDVVEENNKAAQREYTLLSVIAKTINSRKKGSESWLLNDDVAYDVAMELMQAIKRLDCYNAPMEYFEKVVQSIVNQRLIDYAVSAHKVRGSKASAIASGSAKFVGYDEPYKEYSSGKKSLPYSECLGEQTEPNPSEIAEIRDTASRAQGILKKMDAKSQKCFQMHVDGIKNVEIARRLGLDQPTVSILIKQVREELLLQLSIP